MNRKNLLRVLWRSRFSAITALAALGLLFIPSGAQAGGCAVNYKAGTAAIPSSAVVSPHGDDQQGDDGAHGPASIVGVWHLIYTATYSTAGPLPFPVIPPGPPNSFTLIESFKTWHADGTEFENAFLAPTGGNICAGVWKDAGDGSVKLHHIGLMFDSTGGVSFIFTVDEKDTVNRNDKTYKGYFTFKLWPASYDQVGVGMPLQEVSGTTAGTRITVD
jgi:hypothetical protein